MHVCVAPTPSSARGCMDVLCPNLFLFSLSVCFYRLSVPKRAYYSVSMPSGPHRPYPISSRNSHSHIRNPHPHADTPSRNAPPASWFRFCGHAASQQAAPRRASIPTPVRQSRSLASLTTSFVRGVVVRAPSAHPPARVPSEQPLCPRPRTSGIARPEDNRKRLGSSRTP